MKRIAMVAALLMAGCGHKDDPATSRLVAGSQAILTNGSSTAVRLSGPNYMVAEAGEKALVISDEEDDRGDREVTIRVLGGVHEGDTARVGRSHLRPITSSR